MNRLFIIILISFLSLPVSVQAVDNSLSHTASSVNIVSDIDQDENTTVLNTIDEEHVEVAKEASSDTDINTGVENIPYKKPVSKKKIAFKFLAAMGGVAISSFMIFVLLSLYNRIRDSYKTSVKTVDGETSLETPDDLDSAIKTFMDKTDWKY